MFIAYNTIHSAYTDRKYLVIFFEFPQLFFHRLEYFCTTLYVGGLRFFYMYMTYMTSSSSHRRRVAYGEYLHVLQYNITLTELVGIIVLRYTLYIYTYIRPRLNVQRGSSCGAQTPLGFCLYSITSRENHSHRAQYIYYTYILLSRSRAARLPWRTRHSYIICKRANISAIKLFRMIDKQSCKRERRAQCVAKLWSVFSKGSTNTKGSNASVYSWLTGRVKKKKKKQKESVYEGERERGGEINRIRTYIYLCSVKDFKYRVPPRCNRITSRVSKNYTCSSEFTHTHIFWLFSLARGRFGYYCIKADVQYRHNIKNSQVNRNYYYFRGE